MNEPVTILRPSCRRACGGDAVAGALLSRAADLQLQTPGEPFERTLSEWGEDLHGLVGEKKIRTAISQLMRAGFLTQKRDGKAYSYTVDLARVERATGGLVGNLTGRMADVGPETSAIRPTSGDFTGHMADVGEPSTAIWPTSEASQRPYGRREAAVNGHMADVGAVHRPYDRREGDSSAIWPTSDSLDSGRARTGAPSLSSSSEESQEAESVDDYYRQIESSWRGANERPLHAPNVFYEKCGGDAETARRIRDDACAAAAAGSTRDLFWFLKDWSPAYRPPPAESGPAAGRAKAAAAKPWYEDDDQVDELIREANRRGIR